MYLCAFFLVYLSTCLLIYLFPCLLVSPLLPNLRRIANNLPATLQRNGFQLRIGIHRHGMIGMFEQRNVQHSIAVGKIHTVNAEAAQDLLQFLFADDQLPHQLYTDIF